MLFLQSSRSWVRSPGANRLVRLGETEYHTLNWDGRTSLERWPYAVTAAFSISAFFGDFTTSMIPNPASSHAMIVSSAMEVV